MTTSKFPLPLGPAHVTAYINAVFQEARHGNTFAKEGQALIKEMLDKEFGLSEYFSNVEREPVGAFEKAMRLRAHRIAKEN